MEEPEEIHDQASEEATASQEDETSLDEIIARKADEAAPEEAEEAEEAPADTGREERVEALTVKVVPQQPTEFTCRNCYLVKHRSQLADKKRMLCRDCA